MPKANLQPSKAAAKARAKQPASGIALSTKVSDDAVKDATGRDWAAWIVRLDKAGAADMTHKQIAEHLAEAEGVAPWWAQMVTVGYEQAKGRRAKHEKTDGFSVSGSKTIAAPIERVFEAFTQARTRSAWLKGVDLTVRKATEFKSARITWNSGTGVQGEAGTSVEVNLYEKAGKTGDPKTMVQVQHNKLPDAAAAEAIKAWWKQRLGVLATRLES